MRCNSWDASNILDILVLVGAVFEIFWHMIEVVAKLIMIFQSMDQWAFLSWDYNWKSRLLKIRECKSDQSRVNQRFFEGHEKLGSQLFPTKNDFCQSSFYANKRKRPPFWNLSLFIDFNRLKMSLLIFRETFVGFEIFYIGSFWKNLAHFSGNFLELKRSEKGSKLT